MKIYSSTIDTPTGPFAMVVDADGSVLAAGWTAATSELVTLIHPSLLHGSGDLVVRTDLGPAMRAAKAYHDGDLTAPAAIPVRQHSGGTFLPAVWKTLRDVEPGRPVSYTELATRAGNPAAVRAAAQGCARNAAALFVPCHRVIRTDGTLGGFRWGLTVKDWLIRHEA